MRLRNYVCALLVFIPVLALQAQQKYALVIGNGAYTTVSRLNNPVNDANDMADTLRGLGFQVDLLLNGSLEQMEDGAIRLKNRLSTNAKAYGFFFYAGHGVQSGGENYLIPVNADIKSESFLRSRALQMQAVLDELNQAGNALNIVVLDACRDNPFSWGRSGSRGLQVVNVQPADSIIVYATSAGKTAADGVGRNGLFTRELLKNLKTPGLTVRDVFDRTGADVSRVSNREQIPAIYSQFFGTAYLGGTQPVAPPERPVPDGFIRINGGTFTMGSPASEAGRRDREGPQHQVTVSGFYMGRNEVTVGEFRRFVNAAGYEISDGGAVWTSNGWEWKGDANWKNPYFSQGENQPVVLVSWYDAIEYCNWRSREEGLTPAYTIDKSRSDPNNRGSSDTVKWVVTWNRSANGYRLPTEAEWEYACRAGTTTPFSTGTDITTNQANYSGSRGKTGEVGSFAPNAWGLYDMHGNVQEWCWDWFGSYSGSSQTDPLGAAAGSSRVRRGGAWGQGVQYVRSADRSQPHYPFDRNWGVGFRIVRP